MITETVEAPQQKQFQKEITNIEVQAQKLTLSGHTRKALELYYKILGYYKRTNNSKKIVQTLMEMANIYKQKGELKKSEQKLEEALAIINREAPASSIKGDVFFNLARVYHDMGKIDKAIENWKYSIPIYESDQKDFLVAMANRYIGFSYRDLEQEETAIEYFQLSLPHFKNLDNKLYAANTSNAIGLAFLAREEFVEAIEYFQEALELYKLSDNPYDHLTTLFSMSIAYGRVNKDKQAISLFLQGLNLVVQNPSISDEQININNIELDFLDVDQLNIHIERMIKKYQQQLSKNVSKQDIINIRRNLASLHKIRKEYDTAISIYEQAANELSENKHELAHIYQNLGLILTENRDLEKALEYYKKALGIFKQEKRFDDSSYAIIGISKVLLVQGDPDGALDNLKETFSYFNHDLGALIKATIFNSLGNIYRSKGILDKSLEMHLQALDLLQKTANPLDEAINLHYLGETYLLLEEYDAAFDKFTRALQLYDVTLPSPQKAKTLTGLGNVYRYNNDTKKALQMYEQAMKIQFKDNINKSFTLNNLVDVYIQRKEYEKAVEHAIQSLNILNQSPNPLLKAIPLKKLGRIYYIKGEREKAYEFCAQAAEIYEESPNPNDIKKPLNIIFQYEPERAVDLALSSALGCNWILTGFKEQRQDNEVINVDAWYNVHLASSNIWDTAILEQQLGLFETGQFTRNWKLQYLIREVERSISPETTFNFLFGANDVMFDPNNVEDTLRDSQPELQPLWFVEIPPFVYHGQQFLKIRLNNLVQAGGEFTSLPTLGSSNPPISRLKIQMETQWLQKIEVDNIFYPNSDHEYRAAKNDPINTRLSDIVIMELGDHTKRVNKIVLTYSIQVFLSEDTESPDFTSTTNTITIPVIRRKNYQKLENYKERHNNFLAILLASWSILLSGISWLLSIDLGFITRLDPILLLIVTSSLGLGVVLLILWLNKSINLERSRVTKSSESPSHTKSGKLDDSDLYEYQIRG